MASTRLGSIRWFLIAGSLLLPSVAQATRPVDPSVVPPTVLRIEVSAPQDELSPGESLQLVVQAEFADGSLQDVTAEADYDASPEELAEVSPAGLVQALQRGEVTINVVYSLGGTNSAEASRALDP